MIWIASGKLQPVANGKPTVLLMDLQPISESDRLKCNNVPLLSLTCAVVPGSSSKKFNAYYLPFKQDDAVFDCLDNNADFFFTDTLSGCTVSVGFGQKPLVGHLNFLAGDNVDQGKIDSMVNMAYPTGHRAVKKSDYQSAGVGIDGGATCLGIRNKDNGVWDFYYQHFKYEPYNHEEGCVKLEFRGLKRL